MRRTVRLSLSLLAACALLCAPAAAQGFGKNKPSYVTFDWKVYQSPHFDIHYYPEAEHLLEDVVNAAESAYLDLSERLDHEISARIPLLMYRTHAEFRQTNVSLQEIPTGAGAFAEPFQKRMVLPIDDPPDKRYKLIRHELVHIFEFDILYGESLRRVIRSQPPLWIMEGLASYLADDEDSFDQMIIRDAVVNNRVPSVNQLAGFSFLTYRFGNAIFSFIEQEYGAEGIRTFLFEYRKALVARDVSKVFQDAFGLNTEQFDRRFARYLRKRYLPILIGKRSPEEYGPEIGLTKSGRFTFSPELSPSGDLLAALATPSLELDVVVLSTKDGEQIRNVTKGFTNRYENVATNAFEGKRDLAWSPGGDRLAFFVENEAARDLLIHDPVSGRRIETIKLRDISEPTSPAFAPDGRSIAFSGNRDGFWDIFRLDLETKAIENLTADPYFDSNPRWSRDGEQLLYNRRIGAFEKIFTVQVGAPERKTQLTAGAASDIQPEFSRDGKHIYFSSDRGAHGIFNLHRLELASGKIERLTDLVGGAFAPVDLGPADDGTPQIAYAAFFGGTFRLFRMKVGGDEVARAREAGEEEPSTSPRAPSRRRAPRTDPASGDEGGESPESVAPEPGERPDDAATGPAQPAAPGVPRRAAAVAAGAPGPAFTRTASPAGRVYGHVEPSYGMPRRSARPSLPLFARTPVTRWFEPLSLHALPGASPRPGALFAPQSDGAGDDDLEPFRPPLQLGIDEERKTEYKANWSLDTPSIFVGLTDDGRFLSNISLQFTDMVGDRRIFVRSASVDNFSSNTVAYLNVRKRLDWGARFRDSREFFLVGNTAGSLREGRNRFTAVDAFAQFPLSRYYRLEGSAGYGQQRNEIPFVANPTFGTIGLFSVEYDFPFAQVALVGDTTRFQSFGPFHGHRFRIGTFFYNVTSGDFDGQSLARNDIDIRLYQRITSRSLLAFRAAAILQTGDSPTIFGLGGTNQLRGIEFRELFGENIAWANLELRIPLIDAVFWSFGLPMGPVRGFLFADAGAAWFKDEFVPDGVGGFILADRAAFDVNFGGLREFRSRENGLLRDLKVSAGFGLNVNFLGLPLNWSWARIWDGEDFGSSRSEFYIVFDW